MIQQNVVKRESKVVDNGTMGFHDYETVKEDLVEFVNRVTSEANLLSAEIVTISYPSEDIAIIVYR